MIECLRKLRREASVTLLGWSLFGLSVMVGFSFGRKKNGATPPGWSRRAWTPLS